jgi:NTP pyrophosphatase (non-canonical NTP hydrolase)
MAEKSLRQIQQEIAEWSQRNFGDNVSKAPGFTYSHPLGSLCSLLGIGEESGELYHVVLKRLQGIRGYDDDQKYYEERDDAIADLLVYLCDFSSRERVDLQEVLNKVWEKVQKRDWEKNKKDAHEVAEEQYQDELQKARKFKEFVHERLDKMGVPQNFPDGPHTKDGCRIGDRLDWVEKRLKDYYTHLARLTKK